MKKLAVIASAISLAAAGSAGATAMVSDPCMDDAVATCSMFQPVGSYQWAYCVETLYQICIGNYPVSSESVEEMLRAIREGE